MAYTKIIFVAFAIEDERQRDLLKGQSLNTSSPFEYVDMSVKEPYDSEWKARVSTRIRRSDGIIAFVSKNSLTSSGQKWEIECARREKKKVLGVWAYTNDRTNLPRVNTVVWRWAAIEKFIDML
ncbi:MAG: TIR domain-containing protein [Nanoarchaeota archaeon]|nr:TIR domain-containing protein [Nanoarchaeota archaeon]